jgi:hypothetical protein
MLTDAARFGIALLLVVLLVDVVLYDDSPISADNVGELEIPGFPEPPEMPTSPPTDRPTPTPTEQGPTDNPCGLPDELRSSPPAGWPVGRPWPPPGCEGVTVRPS